MSVLDRLDPLTRDAIARSLWRTSVEEADLPPDVVRALAHPGNDPAVRGGWMRSRLDWLLARPDSYTPDYRERYEQLDSLAARGAGTLQAFSWTKFMGKDSSRGFRLLPDQANLPVPQCFFVDLQTQMGWHFFVGHVYLEDGREASVELMFAHYAFLPPELAHRLGITDLENTIIELHLAIALEGDRSYQAVPIQVAGTTGLLEYRDDPFYARQGNNLMESLQPGSLLPMRLRARGRDEGANKEIGFDLLLTDSKPVFYQGDNGCMPCIGGVGTLYLSIPRITVSGDGSSALRVDGQELKVTGGDLWFDHQWGVGVLADANPRSEALRAASQLGSGDALSAWDWFYVQLPENREITGSCIHTGTHLAAYERQTGPEAPPTMDVPVQGKLIAADGSSSDIAGRLLIDRWERAERSPEPALYHPSGTWHPARWHYTWDAPVPEDIRQFTMERLVPGHILRWAAGDEYGEGLAIARNPQGTRIGQGFQESVAYGDTAADKLALAGLDDTPAVRRVFSAPQAGFASKAGAAIFLLDAGHRQALADDIAKARGVPPSA